MSHDGLWIPKLQPLLLNSTYMIFVSKNSIIGSEQNFLEIRSFELFKGPFTLGVKDSNVESFKHHSSHLRLKLTYREDFMLN